LFRDCSGDYIGGFADNLGMASSIFAELMGAIHAIEIAQSKGWNSLWLETDSNLFLYCILGLKKSMAELLMYS
jgi:ribonuclease HI